MAAEANPVNALRAQKIRAAIENAKAEQYGLYKLRLCLFEALEGTDLSASWLSEELLPRAGVLDQSLSTISMLPAWIEAAEDISLSGTIKVVKMWLLLDASNKAYS